LPRLDCFWLGAPRVEAAGRALRLETRKVTALLALLSLERRPQSREYLAALLWPEFDARRAPANLRRALASLQASLGPGRLRADRETIALEGDIRVDLEELCARVQEARAHHPGGEPLCPACAGKLAAAAGLYRGDFLEGFNLKDCPAFDQWQLLRRETLAGQMAWALERLSEADAAAGRWEAALEHARRRLALDELHEPAHRALMFLYAKRGRQSAALKQYETCERLLREELGQEPEESTRALAERIRGRRLEAGRAPAATTPGAPGAGAGQAAPEPAPAPAAGSAPPLRPPVAPPTRLHPPPVRPRRVQRPRLHALLDAGLERPLTLISAPPGFGKTTLLVNWAARRSLAAAWLSLEEDDNDPAHLLAGIAAALGALEPGLGREALRMLHSMQGPPLAAVTASLLEDLLRQPAPRVLMLDDFHLVTRLESQKLAADFAERLPPDFHLMIATRMDPAFPLARLRARDQLVELRADDLRFLPEEATAFLHEVMGLELSEEDIAVLEKRTEGWAAGLQMAALSLQNREDRSGFIRGFGGSHRHVVDYLVGEVLEMQPPGRQKFLLVTAVLARFCASLCDELFGGTGSQEILEELERSNLFLVPLDEERAWYRYHHLFADLLRHRLRQSLPAAEIEELHLRAGRWLDSNGDPEGAMRHFLAGGKHQEAIRLLNLRVDEILTRGGLGTLLRWGEKLSDREVRRSPETCVTLGSLYVWAGRVAEAERYFTRAETLLEGDASAGANSLRGRTALMRAFVADVAGATDRAIELARLGDRLIPAGTFHLTRSFVPYILSRAYRFRGEGDRAEACARELASMARSVGNVWTFSGALHELIWLYRVQGRLREADRVLEEFDAFPREEGGAGPVAKVIAVRGELQRERGDLAAAARTIATAQEEVRRWGLPSDVYFCSLLRCRLAFSQGDLAGADEEIRRADETARTSFVYASAIPPLEAERARVLLALGRREEALAWLESCPLPGEDNPLNREVIGIARARVLLAAGRPAEGAELLGRLAAAAEAGKRNGRLLEILVLQAASGGGEAAEAALRRALELAEPEGYARIFLDEGEPLARRLRDLLGRPGALSPGPAAYARRLTAPAPH
jgi:LuxR family maltose regulon positive regulatory protein